jgi:hypothetical protein
MIARTTNPNVQNFKRYGGDPDYPVTVCSRWLGPNGFINFKKDLGDRPVGTTLDRVNPFLGYWPSNCRYATPAEQNSNTRKTWLKKFGTPFPELASQPAAKPALTCEEYLAARHAEHAAQSAMEIAA